MEETLSDKQSNLSSLLKEKREEMGISVEQLAKMTKISYYNITQLELGHFEQLPNKVFVRGYVKAICKALNLNEVDLLKNFDEEIENFSRNLLKGSQNEILSPLNNKTGRSVVKGGLSFKGIFTHKYFYGVVLLLMVVGLFIVYHNHSNSTPNSSFSEVGEEKVQDSMSSTDEDPSLWGESSQQGSLSVSSQGLEESVSSGEPTGSDVTKGINTETLSSLELSVIAPLKISVRVDQGKEEAKDFTTGHYNFNFKDKIDFWIDDLSKIKISYQGKELAYPNMNGQKRRLIFYSKSFDEIEKVRDESM